MSRVSGEDGGTSRLLARKPTPHWIRGGNREARCHRIIQLGRGEHIELARLEGARELFDLVLAAQMLLEREIRDAEMLMDGQSLRADIVRLQKGSGMKLSVPDLADMLPDLDDASAAAKLQSAMFLKGIEGSPVPSHTKLL